MFFLVTQGANSQTTSTFNFTGGSQTFVVPPCVTSIAVTINGGQGGGTTGGLGATVTGNISVTPGQALQIIVGGQGSCPGTVYAGGGPSATQNYAPFQPCGGGGYSAIFSGGTPLALAAGGGGKAGGDMGGAGGAGGCATGGGGTSPFGQAGGGATQTAGGAGGPPWTAGGGSGTAGSYLQGGTGGNDLQFGNAAGGGGGGGYYGGGGGGSDNIGGTTFIGGGGGGGGSSLVPAGFGCTMGGNSGAGQVVITYVGTAPIITVNSATVCMGASAVLTAGGGTTYTWQPGGMTGSSISVSPGATTTYTVSSGSAGCVATKTTQVVVNPAPPAFANSNSPVCLNTPINFVGSGGGTYSWSGPNGFSSTLQNPVIASAQTINGGTYSLIVTSAAGCTATATEFVTVNPLPVPVVNNPTVCVNQTINLTSNGGSTYSWSGPNGFSSTLQNPSIANASMSMSGTYNIIVTSAAGCTASAQANVTVITLPNPSFTSNTPCVGATLLLSGSGGGTYSWTGSNGFTSGVQNPTIPNVTSAAGGGYSLVVTLGSCTGVFTAPVVINPLPVPTANSNSPVCLNKTINFNGGGGSTYSWSGPSGFTSTLQNPTISSALASNAGIYTLTVTNSNGCTNTITTNVTVNPLPIIAVTHPTVCVNQTINLTASGGLSYSWSGPNGFSSTLQNPTLPNATMLMSGNYPVLVTSAAGCTASATSSVTVITLPNPSFTSNTPCVGTTLTFTGSGGGLYNWTGPNGFTSGVQNPIISNVSMAANGTYSLIVTIGTCSNITSGAVTVNPLPVPTASNNSPVCVNTSLNLTGGGGTSYSWSGPNGYTNSTQNPVIASAQSINSGVYSLTVTNSNGCTNTITTNVTVNPLPVIAVTHPTICVNQTINLSSGGGATYAWSGSLGYSSSLQNPSITNATQNMSGSYTVTATSAAGCTMTNVSNVLVLALPTPSITSNTPCAGATLFLGGSGGGAYSWSGPNGFISTNQNPTISNVSIAANGTYSLLVSVGICTNNTTAQVTINPLPNPAITGNSAVCLNQSTGFTATGGVSYTWAGPNGFTGSGPSITIASANNLNTGSYVVTATNANNCSNTASAFLTVNPLPIIAAIGSTVCANQNITLSASGGTMYVWNGQNGFTSGAQFPVISNASASMSGNYSVTVTDVNGCISTSVTNVKVNPIPTPTAAGNSPICANQTITLNAGAPTGVSYIWSGPNGYVANAQNLQITPANVSSSGPYVVTVSDNIGCAASVTVNMIVNPLPSGVISSDKKEGCIPLCVSFTCQAATALQSSVWDFGTGGSAVGNVVSKCYERDGTFNIKAIYTDINGCSNSSTYSVVAYPIPSADFNFAPQKPVEGEDVQFTNSSYGQGTSFYWYFSHLTNTVIAEHNPAMIYQTQGGYAVTLITVSDKGCRDTITKAVMVGEDYGLYVPNAFTPNGDGINDVFFPKGFGIVKYELNIFDRWGERLFTTNKFEEGWPGNYTGRTQDMVPNGVYVWQIRVLNVFGKSKELTGKVTVTK
ncbi:MAG: gliding motility-associated C-terminal domain-containing protein [Bacteroidetes bacterium]|nr:gliding motility-associated C-terminal domain-containing protein [Bacteroidota bacterium]